jgi:protein involved in polysaccharide export with SLBB domain/Flp pilus assembly protein TadD
MFPTLLLSAVLILSVSLRTSGQTTDRQMEPPLVAHNGETSTISKTGESRPQVSAQSRAEAKRLYKEGAKYGNAGLPKQAAEIFQRIIQLDPEYADAYYGLGHAYFDLGLWDKAADALQTLLKFIPNDDQGQKLLSRVEAMRQRERNSPPTQKNALTNPVTKQPVGTNVMPNIATPKLAHERPSSAQPQASLDKPATQQTVAANVAPANIAAAPGSDEASEKPEVDKSLATIYRVGVGDVLDVRLTDATTNVSTLFTVTPSGLLQHPNLPDPLPVAGLTVEDITAALQADLKRRALNETKVWVGVRDYSSHAVLVSGLVKEPGTKILRREAIPLYVVIADAQPLPEAARLSLIRNRTNEVFSIDLIDIKEMDRLVLPGDVITVQPNVIQFFYVSGEVKSPGEKTFRRGLTLMQALMVAGGVTPKSKEARIAREDGNGFLVMTRYKLKDIETGKGRDPQIQPGDRITIVE